jgi:hypothetical protein
MILIKYTKSTLKIILVACRPHDRRTPVSGRIGSEPAITRNLSGLNSFNNSFLFTNSSQDNLLLNFSNDSNDLKTNYKLNVLKNNAMKTTKQITSQLRPLLSVNIGDNFFSQLRLRIIFSLFIAFFALNTSAQTLQEYQTMLAGMNSSTDPVIRAQATHLDSLVFQVQPKIHLVNLVSTVTGGTLPVCLETDDESVGMLSTSVPLYQTVELITVRLNGPDDLNFVLNLTALPGFGSLKYIQFLCGFQCDPQLINALFTTNNPGITVFYFISIPN